MTKQLVRILLIFSLSASAWADLFGIPVLQPKTDNKLIQLRWEGSSGGRAAPAELNLYVLYLINQVRSATGIAVQTFSQCDPLIDMRFNDNLTGDQILGYTNCEDYADTMIPYSVCVESTVQINPGLIDRIGPDIGVPPATGKISNWCHEGGYAFGMQHDSEASDCMRQGLTTLTSYNSHHLSHIREDLDPY